MQDAKSVNLAASRGVAVREFVMRPPHGRADQAWMGHADVKTTMRYLYHKSHDQEADLLDGAFAVEAPLAAVASLKLHARCTQAAAIGCYRVRCRDKRRGRDPRNGALFVAGGRTTRHA